MKEKAYIQDPAERRDRLTEFVKEQQGEAAEFAEDQTSEDKIIELIEAILEVLHEIDQKLEGRVNNG